MAEKYAVVRGRHRAAGGRIRGVTHLRCDVHKGDGKVELRVIPIDQLVDDADSQLEYTFNEKWARKLAANWDDELAGVIDVVPLNGHAVLTAEEKNRLKLGKDRDRRSVKHLEVFLNEVRMGDPVAREIDAIAREIGWEIGKLKNGEPAHRIESAYTLRQIHRRGIDHYRSTLRLATIWRGDPKANENTWLGALSLLVAEAHTEDLTPTQYARLEAVVPGEWVRWARGKAELAQTGQGERGGLAPLIAERLRKHARLRRRND